MCGPRYFNTGSGRNARNRSGVWGVNAGRADTAAAVELDTARALVAGSIRQVELRASPIGPAASNTGPAAAKLALRSEPWWPARLDTARPANRPTKLIGRRPPVMPAKLPAALDTPAASAPAAARMNAMPHVKALTAFPLPPPRPRCAIEPLPPRASELHAGDRNPGRSVRHSTLPGALVARPARLQSRRSGSALPLHVVGTGMRGSLARCCRSGYLATGQRTAGPVRTP